MVAFHKNIQPFTEIMYKITQISHNKGKGEIGKKIIFLRRNYILW